MLVDLVPPEKRIVFQTHFRPNIIHSGKAAPVENRELIFKAVTDFCETYKDRMAVFDPSVVIQQNNLSEMMDGDLHFTPKGHQICFDALYSFL